MTYEQCEAHASKTRELITLMFSEKLLERGDHATVDALLAFLLWGMPTEQPDDDRFSPHAFDAKLPHSLLGIRYVSNGDGTSVLGQLLAMKSA